MSRPDNLSSELGIILCLIEQHAVNKKEAEANNMASKMAPPKQQQNSGGISPVNNRRTVAEFNIPRGEGTSLRK